MMLPFPREPIPPCRPYQIDVLERGAAEIAKGAQSLLFCMPTGTGKTRTAVEACLRHVALGGICLFVAPRRELVSQASAAFERAGLELEHVVFVRTIQQLTMPGATIPPASLVVLDEARHYVADEWRLLEKVLPDAIFLGLDATPERGDGRGLGRSSGGIFDVLLEAISVKDAIAQGYLVPCEVVRPERSLGSDWAQDPLDIWLEKAEGLSTVTFCDSVASAHKLAARFLARGVSAAAVWGEMPVAERDRVLGDFAAGKITVLTNMHLLTEGWDAPNTECVMLASLCPTAGTYLQRIGRGMRPSSGKRRMLLLDLPGVSHDHGDPDEERSWHLDGVACRRTNAPEVRFCPICGAQTTTSKCEQCGYAGDQMKKRRPRVLGLPMDRFARQRGASDEEKAKALAGYLAAARSKGHQRWWAFKCFEHKYGAKPSAQLKTMAMRVFLSG
jgi:DNA repair protein RadD